MTRRIPPVWPVVGVLGLGSGTETVAARCSVCLVRLDAQAPHDLRRKLEAHALAAHPAGMPGLHGPNRLVALGPVVTAGAA